MSTFAAAPSDQGTVRADEDFWDLVCADDEWLRAEFDAIVAAGYPERGDRARPAVRPGHGPWSVPAPLSPPRPPAPGRPARGRGLPRERSPP